MTAPVPHQIVQVSGAPGYADFTAELLMNVVTPDGAELTAVSFQWNGSTEFAIVPTACITPAHKETR